MNTYHVCQVDQNRVLYTPRIVINCTLRYKVHMQKGYIRRSFFIATFLFFILTFSLQQP